MSPPDDPRRRRLLVALGAGAATCVGAPAAVSLFAPARLRTVAEGEDFLDVIGVDEILAGHPLRVVLRADRQDAWATFRNVEAGAAWLLKNEDGSVVAYSTSCPHLGCAVGYSDKSALFECPCHDGVFDKEGQVVSGPSPRPLDRLETRVEGGRILLRLGKGLG